MDDTDKDTIFEDDVSDSDESLSLDLELSCEICEKTFSSFKSLLQHEKSGNHYKKMSQKKFEKKLSKHVDDGSNSIDDTILFQKVYSECDACKKSFTGPESYYQHLKSKVHHKKVARVKLLEQVTHEGKVDATKLMEIHKQNTTSHETSTEVGASGYSPNVGDTGGSDLDDDLLAETHQFECTDCNKVFTGIEPWHQHLVSKTHEKTLKKNKLREKLSSGTLCKGEKHTEAAGLPLEYLDPIEVNGDVLVCKLCHKSFSGPESAAAHLKSKGHAKKKELREFKVQFAAKMSNINKTKAQDFRNDGHLQVSEDAAQSHDLNEGKPAIPHEIVDNASVKDFNKPITEVGNSAVKEKSRIQQTEALDFSKQNHEAVASNEENEFASSKEIVQNIATDKDAGNQTQISRNSDFKEDLDGNRENSVNANASKDAAVETENLSDARKDNALLCYEKYKNYKKIMNEIEAEKKA